MPKNLYLYEIDARDQVYYIIATSLTDLWKALERIAPSPEAMDYDVVSIKQVSINNIIFSRGFSDYLDSKADDKANQR